MRLKDADALVDALTEQALKMSDVAAKAAGQAVNYYSGMKLGYANAALIANVAPTIDAVPVVRCKDCKYYKESVVLSPNKFCFRMKDRYGEAAIGYNFAEDDFCSYGERRELPDAESEIDKWWERSETVNAERGEE